MDNNEQTLDRLTTIAAGLMSGEDIDVETYHSSDAPLDNYLRGMVELIADTVGMDSDTRERVIPALIAWKVNK
jgi:hypothetical protein